MLSPYVRELSIGDIIRGSVRLYRSSFFPLLLCYVIPGIPAMLLTFYAMVGTSVPLKVLAVAAVVVCTLFGYTGITLCISDACTGNKPSLLRSLGRGRIALGNLTLASLLLTPLVLAGFVVLLIPGVIFVLWFLYVPMVVVLERRGVWSAIKRSRQLAKGFNLRNFGLLVMGALMLGAAYIFAFLGAIILAAILSRFESASDAASAGIVLGYLGAVLFAYATYPILFIMIVLTYYDLRARKEGFDSMALAAELGEVIAMSMPNSPAVWIVLIAVAAVVVVWAIIKGRGISFQSGKTKFDVTGKPEQGAGIVVGAGLNAKGGEIGNVAGVRAEAGSQPAVSSVSVLNQAQFENQRVGDITGVEISGKSSGPKK